jgi:hypothetical protein
LLFAAGASLVVRLSDTIKSRSMPLRSWTVAQERSLADIGVLPKLTTTQLDVYCLAMLTRLRHAILTTATLIWGVVGFTSPASSQTTSIPVSNGSFATLPPGGLPNDGNGTGYFYSEGPIPGWIETSPTGVGQFQPGTQDGNFVAFSSLPPGGITTAYCNGGTIYQTVGATVQVGVTYTLQVYIGARADQGYAGTADLLIGSSKIIAATGPMPAPGSWSLFTATYTGVASDAGDAITIQLNSSGIQGNFADVVLTGTSTGPTTQILPQLAFGGGWYTALYFTNTSSIPVSFSVNFIGNGGNPLTVPALGGSSVAVSLAARGTTVIQAPNVGSLVQGYVSVALPYGVTAYGVFRQSVPGQQDQEAVVPLSGTTATTSTLLFDDTNYTTGVAVVNLASVSTTISVTAYSNQGNVIGTSNIPLAANAKTAVVLRDLPGLAPLAGSLGSVDFAAPIGTLAALGLRFNGLAFTSIPTSDR